MKNLIITSCCLLLLGAVFLTSCNPDDTDIGNFTYDCADLDLNIGDSCVVDTLVGLVSQDCICIPDSLNNTFDCPNLALNVGDTCTISGTNDFGQVSTDCFCLPDSLTMNYDCPDLNLNVGDTCFVSGSNEFGEVNVNCVCEVVDTTTFDCLDLQLNIGDVCVDSFGTSGNVNDLCICQFDPNYCTNLGVSVGESCTVPGTNTLGTASANCECVANTTYDCPTIMLNFGDTCMIDSTSFGLINLNCICQ